MQRAEQRAQLLEKHDQLKTEWHTSTLITPTVNLFEANQSRLRPRKGAMLIRHFKGVTEKVAAECLGVDVKQIRQWLESGALVGYQPTGGAWKKMPTPFLPMVFAGAKQRAEERGYPLSHFWLHQDNMSNRRLSEVLHARGVRGILLPPLPRPEMQIDLVWSYFSVVSVGAPLARPTFNCMSNDHYQSMQVAMQACWQCGCRRPGFAADRWVNQRIDRRWEASFAIAREQHAFGREIPKLFYEQWDPDVVARWIKREKPDVVFSVFSEAQLGQLKDRGLRIPRDVGIVSLSVHKDDSPLSGIRQHAKLMGAVAVDQLISQVERNETGVPEHPITLTMKGSWNAGRTLRNTTAVEDRGISLELFCSQT